ncbi:Lipopolysaccharide-induced tumor necrosis factor-alpha factor homolog [Anthophora retusa]
MSVTLNHEVAEQSTLTHSRPRASRDILQISSSFSSNKSNPRNEILTVITNYDNWSPDAPSISEDVIQSGDYGGSDLDVQDTYEPSHMVDLPLLNAELPRNNLFTRRTDHRPWSIMRLLNNHFRCMSTVDDEPDTRPHMGDEPPTYSTIYATHGTRTNNWRRFRSTNESSFIAPIPPPSYAQTQGICLASYSMDHLLPISRNTIRLDKKLVPYAKGKTYTYVTIFLTVFVIANTSRQWSSRPTTAVCPRCTIIVVTTIQVRHSINTHATAFALFLCGCWPCCLIPYCLNTCKTIDHYCPVCRAYLGTYRPC